MNKIDNIWLGLLIGLIVPIVGSGLYYLIQFSRLATLKEFVYYLSTNRTLVTAMLSVSLVGNIAIFTLFINSRKDQAAKGIFIATVLYAVASLIWKFLL